MTNIQAAVASGAGHVVASGIVTAFSSDEISIILGPLRFEFRFSTDNSRPDHNLQASVPEPNRLVLTLTNFNSPLGMGSTKPLPIGSLMIDGKNRSLCLHFRVYSLGDADKTLQYTFYTVEEPG